MFIEEMYKKEYEKSKRLIDATKPMLVVGRKLYYKQHGNGDCGYGAIVEEIPAGNYCPLSYRVIFEDGREMKPSVSSILPGYCCVWEVLPEVVSTECLEGLKKAAAERKEREVVEMAAKEAEFKNEVDRLKQEFPYLQIGKHSNIAAKNIRRLLKMEFPNVKFSVRVVRYSTINVSWTDGPTIEEVKATTHRFKVDRVYGTSGIYEWHNTPFNDTFGSAGNIFCERAHSGALI